ncbi:MAG TPA: HlyD family efflux transporter periplasmic adaptor subunit [Usitatibacter sp.]|jgi:membrane fusion protein|nr:HlyD family efflux transporter periplasmic adaptor subunit [Usitatibacter sp.]
MPDSLFREESEEARANRWLGRVVLIRPISFTFLTVAALVFTIALAAFFTFGEYTRKARVTGVLAPSQGVARVIAQQSGLVEAVHVREGDRVGRDAVMIVLGDGREGRGRQEVGSALLARLAEREAAIVRQREASFGAMRAEEHAYAEKGSALARELRQVDAEIATQARRNALAGGSLDRANRLADIGFVSPAQLERERDAQLEQVSRLEQLERGRIALARETASVAFEAEGARLRASAQLAALDLQRAGVGQERIERDLQFHAAIVAPAAGTVATVLVQPGQMVTAGTVLATLIPAGSSLEAHLYAPSRSIGFVHEGEEVLLRYLAYPHQKFGMHPARIIAVSRNPMLPGELGFTPVDGTREPVYRIKAALGAQSIRAYGRFEPLQPGMQVEADVLLDRRRLVEWIFEPLLGLAGRT